MKLRWPSFSIPNGVRALGAGAIGVGGAIFFANFLDRTHKLKDWFAFDLAKIWLWEIFLWTAVISTGTLVVQKLVPDRDRSRLETLAFAYPVGVIVFVLGMYLGGFLHLLGPVFAVALPALMLAAGAPNARAAWQRARATGTMPRLSLTGLPLIATVFGVLLLGLMYLGAMSPDAINYDATWYHLVIAQDTAREGHIVGFPGDWLMNVPHLGSVVNTWAFIVPGLPMPQLRWMMALHTEFVAVVWTMVGISAATRWLAGRDVAGTWAAFVLFPALYVYDHNIGGAADHYMAMFTAPILLATGRALQRFDRRWCLLLGAISGGALATKVQAHYLLAPIALVGLVQAVVLAVRRRRGDPDAPSLGAIAAGFGVAAAAGFVVMLPHFATNTVWFHNPLYPFAQDIFTGTRPTVKDGGLQANNILGDWHFRAPAVLSERLKDASEMAFTFSFIPHYSFVGELPIVGSVFTLALPFLLVIRNARRLWLGAFIAMGSIFVWASTYWVDRNLQTFLPVMIVVTAAILVRAWELGVLARVGVAALVLIQVAWGSGLYVSGNDRMGGALHLLRSTSDGRGRDILAGYRSQYVALGNALPPDATILFHNNHCTLGFDRRVIFDWVGFQGLIDYRLFKTPRDVWDRFHAVGVTHVVWVPGQRALATKQEEILWNVFAETLQDRRQFGEYTVAPLPKTPPPAEAPYQVLVVGVSGLADGLYPIDQLSSTELLPPAMRFQAQPAKTAPSPGALLDEAKVVLMGGGGLDPAATEKMNRDFSQVPGAVGVRVLLRR
jgi:hypothetical protein